MQGLDYLNNYPKRENKKDRNNSVNIFFLLFSDCLSIFITYDLQ